MTPASGWWCAHRPAPGRPRPNGQSGALDALAGIPVGSRVLVELPPSKDAKGKAIGAFAVIDILNAFPAPKQQ